MSQLSVDRTYLSGTDGNFYGTTYTSGSNGWGTIFKITPEGIFTLLHSFHGGDGANPTDALIQSKDGNFYGTTMRGGSTSSDTCRRLWHGLQNHFRRRADHAA
jgi:uncharacterized repeat protein (TIGR03803 family)